MPNLVTPTLTRIAGDGNSDGWKISWTPLANGDTGAAVGFPGYADRSVQVTGTFGSGGSCAVEGSNLLGDNTQGNYAVLNDPQGTALAITTAAIKQVTEAVLFVRPHVTAGDGTTALTVTMFARKTQQP